MRFHLGAKGDSIEARSIARATPTWDMLPIEKSS
jgi:hypothetical protein